MGTEGRQTRTDLIEVFKIIHGLSSIKFSTFFKFSTYDCTKSHSLKLAKNVRYETGLTYGIILTLQQCLHCLLTASQIT